MAKAKARDQWRNRIVGHGEQAAGQFMANPGNWRVHPKAQRQALAGVLGEVGWVQSVVVNRTTGHVVDGHARIEEALKLGDETPVPFIEVELSEDEEAKILATLDPISSMAGTDRHKLDELLQQVSTSDQALSMLIDQLHTAATQTSLEDARAENLTDSKDDSGSVVKALFAAADIDVVERAIRSTGEINRGVAIAAICRDYLHGKGQLDAAQQMRSSAQPAR